MGCLSASQRCRELGLPLLHTQRLQAARPYCSAPPSSPSACMQENSPRDFGNIVPVKETGEKESPFCKASLFFLFFCVGALMHLVQSPWKCMGQHQHMCKVSLSPEQRCVDGEYCFYTLNIQDSFISFFFLFPLFM